MASWKILCNLVPEYLFDLCSDQSHLAQSSLPTFFMFLVKLNLFLPCLDLSSQYFLTAHYPLLLGLCLKMFLKGACLTISSKIILFHTPYSFSLILLSFSSLNLLWGWCSNYITTGTPPTLTSQKRCRWLPLLGTFWLNISYNNLTFIMLYATPLFISLFSSPVRAPEGKNIVL